MNITIGLFIRAILVLLMLIAGIIFYPQLPDQIPIHWNLAGVADGFGPKIWALWLMPVLSLVFMILFPLLARIDPKKENYKHFQGVYDITQTIIILFLGYIFGVTLYITLQPEQSHLLPTFMMGGLGVLLIIIGNFMGKIRQNYFIGLRTPWTLNDKEVWQKSQRFGGYVFILAGLFILISGFTGIYTEAILLTAIIALVVVPIGYSYMIYKRKANTGKTLENK